MDQSFGKEYKLCNTRHIDHIYGEGRTIKQYPILAKYARLELPTKKPFQLVIGAPKRTFRSAVKRNRIKRICREAVRKNKTILESWLEEHSYQLGIFLLYTGKEEITSIELEKKVQQLFQKIIDDIHATHD